MPAYLTNNPIAQDSNETYALCVHFSEITVGWVWFSANSSIKTLGNEHEQGISINEDNNSGNLNSDSMRGHGRAD